MKKLFFGVLLLCFSGLAAQNFAVSSISEDLKKDAKAVVRESFADIKINSINDMTTSVSKTITIMNKSGEEHGFIAIPYNKSKKVYDIKVVIFDENGKQIKKYIKSDFTDVSHSPNFALYTDDRILILPYTSNVFPYTIHYSYTYNTGNTIFLPSFVPYTDEKISVEITGLKITNKSNIPLRKKIKESPLAELITSENGIVSEFYYKNVKALVHQTMAPTLEYLMPKVEFSLERFSLEGKQGDFKDWNSFGKWYYENLLMPMSVVTPEIKQEIASLNLKGTTSEKVKTIFQHMQKNTRYVLVAMGIGGWQPMPVEEVHKKGYGDCKALTNYMKALLDAAGIPSYFSIITSDDSPISFDKDFPKMGGNHAILVVPTENGNIWLENTSQSIAFNHLDYRTKDRNVLAVKNSGIEIINTPNNEAKDSKEILKSQIKINEDNSANISADFEYSGAQYDYSGRLLTFSPQELKDFLKEYYNTLKPEQFEVNNFSNDKDKGVIKYTINTKSNDYSKKLGNDIFFRVMPFHERNSLKSDEERVLPFEISFPYQDEYEIEYILPVGYHLTETPKPTGLTSEFGTYMLTVTEKDGKIFVKRFISINKGIYPKEKFKSYSDFIKKVNNIDNTKVLITKS